MTDAQPAPDASDPARSANSDSARSTNSDPARSTNSDPERPTNSDPERSTKKPWPQPLRKLLWVVDIVLLAGLAWLAWAAIAFYQFRSGLQDGDRISLDRQIEWSSVLDGLRADVQAAATSAGGDAGDSA